MKSNVLIIDTDLEICKQIKYALCNTDTDAYYTHSINSFVNAIYLYEDRLVIVFNYKGGSRTVPLAEVEGSDLSLDTALNELGAFMLQVFLVSALA